MKIKALASLSIISMICIIFLTSCSEKSIDGEWELSQSTQNECPIYYEFKTEMKKENKQTVINHLVKMYTNKYIKEDLSKGTYTKIDGNYSGSLKICKTNRGYQVAAPMLIA